MKKKIKMRIVDFWHDDTKENFYKSPLVKLLESQYEFIYSDTPDFIIYGPFGYEHLKYDCVRIFYTGENIRTDWNIADYGIDFDYMEFGDRHSRMPLFLFYRHHEIIMKNQVNPQDIHTKTYKENTAHTHAIPTNTTREKSREKFCGIVVSNDGWGLMDMLRTDFFHILNSYKQVDSGGRWNNNIGGPVTDKIAWLKNYKFNICFENSSYPGYLTEKLFDAFAAGCIPIYWGDTSLRCGVDKTNEYPYSNKQEKNSIDAGDSIESVVAYKTHTNGGGGGTLPISHNVKSPQHPTHSLDITNPNISQSKHQIDMTLPNIPPHLLEYKLNPKAFINAHNFPNLESLLQEVIRIDTDEKAYQAMLQEPIFLDNFNPFSYYEKRLFDFFDSIFSQEPQKAFRRGRGQLLQQTQQYLHIYNYPKDFLRRCRHKIRRMYKWIPK